MSEIANYQLFGLCIRSEMALPELFPAHDRGVPDVTIRRGALSPVQAEPGLSVDGDVLRLNVPDVAQYSIEGGREIVVDPNPGVPERNVRLFLLGSAFGALLHQRRLLPLHANAVEIDGHAVAFMGGSGAGKSTLAAWFHGRGHRIVADDVCVVRFDPRDGALAQPGLPRLRLWGEALEATGRNTTDFLRSYVGDNTFDKYDVPIAQPTAIDREMPLIAVYLLERGDQPSIRPLHGIEAAEAFFAHTYRGGFVSAAGNERDHWGACMCLVRETPLFRVTRTWGFDKLDDQCGRMLEHIRQLRTVSPSEAALGRI